MTSTAPIRARPADQAMLGVPNSATVDALALQALARGRHHGPEPAAAALLRARLPAALQADPLVDAAALLWTACLRVDAADPHWPDRDRVVVSAAIDPALVSTALDLAGHAEDSVTGASTPGQAFGVAVGLALAERFLATRFGRSLIDHRTWLLAPIADFMTGAGFRAALLAGRLRLERLTVICAETAGEALGAELALRLAATLGWTARRIAGGDHKALAAALAAAARGRKPTLLICRPPAHVLAPTAIRLPVEAAASLAVRWRAGGARGAAARRAWLKRVARHPQRVDMERALAGRMGEAVSEALSGLRGQMKSAQPSPMPPAANLQTFEQVVAAMPELVLASAGTAETAMVTARGLAPVGADQFAGRHLPFDDCHTGLAATLGGLVAHGGVVPVVALAAAHLDGWTADLRRAAGQRHRLVVAVELGSGEPGPPLARLRAIPNLLLLRAADPLELAECWDLAIRYSEGPSLLLVAACLDAGPRLATTDNRCARGGYVLAEANGPRRATLIAAGAQLGMAMGARAMLARAGIAVAVVSLPCWDIFGQADPAYRSDVLGAVPRLAIEDGDGVGWERWLGPSDRFERVAADTAADAVVSAVKHLITPA